MNFEHRFGWVLLQACPLWSLLPLIPWGHFPTLNFSQTSTAALFSLACRCCSCWCCNSLRDNSSVFNPGGLLEVPGELMPDWFFEPLLLGSFDLPLFDDFMGLLMIWQELHNQTEPDGRGSVIVAWFAANFSNFSQPWQPWKQRKHRRAGGFSESNWIAYSSLHSAQVVGYNDWISRIILFAYWSICVYHW